MAAAETARLIASLELQDKNFTRGLKAAEKRLGNIDKRLGAASGALNRNLARGIDTVIDKSAELLVGTVKDAAEFESAITGVAKTVTGDITAVTDELKTLSTQIPLSFVELAGIAELGGAMGIAKEDLVAFTEQVAILGTTTNVSTEDAATALGQLQNVIGLTGDEFDNFAASLVELGNTGASTESAILEIAKRSGGAAKLIGVAKDETLGWASAAANLGLNEELAGTALQNLFIKGAKSQAKLAKVAGVSVKKFEKLWADDATGALQLFLKELGELDQRDQLKAIEGIFGKGSGLTRLILGLAGDQENLTKSLEDGTRAWEEGTAAQAEADKRFKTSESMFKRLDNSVKIASATIGEALLPVLNELAQEGIAWLNEPATQKAIKSFAKDLGAGLRGLVSTLKGINWAGIADALGIAAGAAKTIVQAFLGMPSWVQAAVITGWGLNKVTGGLIGDLASGLIKGVLGINAGIVNVNGPVAGGGMGGAGAAGGAGKIMSAVRILGAVTIAGASIALLAQTFQEFATGVGENQADLLEKVNKTSTQGFKETIANLEATNAGIKNMNPLENVLAGIFGGSEIVKNYEMAADRIVGQLEAGALDRDQIVTALNTLKEVVALNPEVKLPETDAAIAALTAAIKKMPVPGKPVPGRVQKPPPAAGVKPGDNLFKQLTQLQREQSGVSDEVRDAKRHAGVKADRNKAAIDALKADGARRLAANKAAVDRAKAAVVTGALNTTTAARTAGINTASAARNAGTTTAAAMSTAASRIVAAVYAAQPIIQPTNIIEHHTTTIRTGSTSGSRRAGGQF